MPPRLYGHTCQSDMIELRRQKDKKQKNIKYWLETYNVKINENEYEMFSSIPAKMKKLLHQTEMLQFLNSLQRCQ